LHAAATVVCVTDLWGSRLNVIIFNPNPKVEMTPLRIVFLCALIAMLMCSTTTLSIRKEPDIGQASFGHTVIGGSGVFQQQPQQFLTMREGPLIGSFSQDLKKRFQRHLHAHC
jgi:glycerol uptake facilitator-like aquaporin